MSLARSHRARSCTARAWPATPDEDAPLPLRWRGWYTSLAMAFQPPVVDPGRERDAWFLVAMGLLLCASAIAPMGGWKAWLHAHGPAGWHLHVEHGAGPDGHAHPHAARADADHDHAGPPRFGSHEGVHAHDHERDDHELDDHEEHQESDSVPCGLSISLPEVLIASSRAQGIAQAAGAHAPTLARAAPFATELGCIDAAACARPACRGSPPRPSRRSGIALVVLRNHAILI